MEGGRFGVREGRKLAREGEHATQYGLLSRDSPNKVVVWRLLVKFSSLVEVVHVEEKQKCHCCCVDVVYVNS
jgi:hypothetical protein